MYPRGATQPFVVMVGGVPSDSTSPVSRGAGAQSSALDANASISANASQHDISEAGSMRSTRAVTGGRPLTIRGNGSPLISALHDGGGGSPPGSPGSGAMDGGYDDSEAASVDFSGFVPSLISQQLPALVSLPGSSINQHTLHSPSSPSTNQVSMGNNVGGSNSQGILSPTGRRGGGGRSAGTTDQQVDPRSNNNMVPMSPNDCSSSSTTLLGIQKTNNTNLGTSSKSQSLSKPLLTPRGGFNATAQAPSSRVAHGTVSGQLYFLSSGSTQSNQSSGGYAGGVGGESIDFNNYYNNLRTNGAKVGTWVLGELNLSEEWVHFLSSEGESFAHATATIEAVNVLDYLNYSEHCCFELVVKEQRRESARELRKRRSHHITTSGKGQHSTGGGVRSRSHSTVNQLLSGSNQRLQQSSEDERVRDAAATIQASGAMTTLPGLFWSAQADNDTLAGSPITPTTTTSVTGANLRTFSSDLQSNNGGGSGAVAPYNDPTCERIVLCALDISTMWEWLDTLDQFLDLPALTRSGISIPEATITPEDPALWVMSHPPTLSPATTTTITTTTTGNNQTSLSPRDQGISVGGPPRSPSAPPSPSPSLTPQNSVSPGESQSARTPLDDDDDSNLSLIPLQRTAVQWGGEGVGSGIDPASARALLQRQADLTQYIKKIKAAAMQLRRQVESNAKPPKRSKHSGHGNEAFNKAVSTVKALLHTLSTTTLGAAVEDVVAAHPATPVLTRHIPQTTNPHVAGTSKELFVQLDRFHRAASRELAKVEVSLSELYPSTRECRGYRPIDLTLSQYTGIFANRVAESVRRQSEMTTLHSVVAQNDNNMTSILHENVRDSTNSSSNATDVNNSHNTVNISQMGAWSNSSALASRFGTLGGGGTASSSSASIDSLVVPSAAISRVR